MSFFSSIDTKTYFSQLDLKRSLHKSNFNNNSMMSVIKNLNNFIFLFVFVKPRLKSVTTECATLVLTILGHKESLHVSTQE